jgi:hypothetical protein
MFAKNIRLESGWKTAAPDREISVTDEAIWIEALTDTEQ